MATTMCHSSVCWCPYPVTPCFLGVCHEPGMTQMGASMLARHYDTVQYQFTCDNHTGIVIYAILSGNLAVSSLGVDRMRGDPNIYRLTVFVRVAETLNVSEAARQLCVAEPAVSRYVKELESATGVRLFDRMGRGVALTEAGLRLQDHARAVIAAAEQWREAVDSVRDTDAGDLRLAASAGWTRILLRAMEESTKARPEVAVRLAAAPYKGVLDLVAQNEVHLGFVNSAPGGTKFEVLRMGSDQVLLVAARDHPLVCSRPTPSDADQVLPLVHNADDKSIPEDALHYLNSFGLKTKTMVELASAELVKEAILAGLGVGLQLKSNIAMELARGELVPVFSDAPPCIVTLCAIRNPRRPLTSVQKAFLEKVSYVLAKSELPAPPQ